MPGRSKGSEICTEGVGELDAMLQEGVSDLHGRGRRRDRRSARQGSESWMPGCPRMPGCLAGVGDLHGRDRRAGCHAGHARLSVRGRRSVWKGSEANTLAAPILYI